MSAEYHYGLCRQHVGNAVEIHTHDGIIHHGVIERVDRDFVYINRFDPNRFGGGGLDGPGGPGVFAWGFSGAFAGGFLGGLTGVALGSIAFFRPYPYFY